MFAQRKANRILRINSSSRDVSLFLSCNRLEKRPEINEDRRQIAMSAIIKFTSLAELFNSSGIKLLLKHDTRRSKGYSTSMTDSKEQYHTFCHAGPLSFKFVRFSESNVSARVDDSHNSSRCSRGRSNPPHSTEQIRNYSKVYSLNSLSPCFR